MTLRLHDHWVWDFWFARDAEDVHVFFLQAPKSLGDPERRHQHARIGHAVSRDLRSWRLLPPPLPEAAAGAFDDRATWTGSVVRDHAGGWWLFYTGIAARDDGRVQRVLAARSEDLTTWRRTDLVLSADPRWYESADWRDPWLAWDPGTGRWRMYVCARVDRGPSDGRGVIGTATSRDLVSWTVEPPVSAPGEFRQLEVPQLLAVGERFAMLFCAGDADHSTERLSRPGVRPEYGTHVLYGDGVAGPFSLTEDAFLSGDNGPSLYAGRILEHEGRRWFLAWHRLDEAGDFVGELSDPFPVTAENGSLAVDFGSGPVSP